MLNPNQKVLLDMLAWFHEFCKENDITYYAVGGTMIGAARHKGFIPWDDDIDLVVPRKDYKRLISGFKEQIDHYILESPYSGNKDFLYSYSKLYDINTTYTERTRHNCKRGLYLDIFPLDAIGNSEKEAINNYRKFDRKRKLLLTRTCAIRKERSWYKNLSIIACRLIPSFLIDDKKLSIEVDEIANNLNKPEYLYVANLGGSYGTKEIVKKEVFGKPTLYRFEDIEIYGPEQYDSYLQHIYGDWRKLPPEDKRTTNHDYVEIDLNKSYLIGK